MKAQQITQTYQTTQQYLKDQLKIDWLASFTTVEVKSGPYENDTFEAQSGWIQTEDEVKVITQPTEVKLTECQSAELFHETQGTVHKRQGIPPIHYEVTKNQEGDWLASPMHHQLLDGKQHHQANYWVIWSSQETSQPQFSVFNGITKGDK